MENTTRRNFLRLLAGAAIAPKVSYFLPPIGGWHSDVIVNLNYVHISEVATWPEPFGLLPPNSGFEWVNEPLRMYQKIIFEEVYKRLRDEKLKRGTIATDDSWMLRANS